MSHPPVASPTLDARSASRASFDDTIDAVFLDGLDGRTIAANAQATLLLGVPRNEILGSTIDRFAPPEQQEACRRAFEVALSGQPVRHFERDFVRADGTTVPADVHLALIRHDDGTPAHVQVIARELGVRTYTERLLLANASAEAGEQFFRTVVREVAEVFRLDCGFVARLDPSRPRVLRMVAWWLGGAFREPATYTTEGMPCDQLLVQGDLVYSNDLPHDYPRAAMLHELGVNAYLAIPLRDLSGRLAGVVGVMHSGDIPHAEPVAHALRIFSGRGATELARLDADEEVRRRQVLLNEAQALAGLGGWTLDLRRGEVWWSDEMYRIAGRDPETFAVTVDSMVNLLHPDDRASAASIVEATVAAGRNTYERVGRLIRPDGTIRYLRTQARIERDDDGRASVVHGASLDVTDRYSRERERDELAYRFHEMASTIKEVFWVCSVGDVREITYLSPAFETVWGVAAADGIHNRSAVLETIHPDDRAAFTEVVRAQDRGDQTDVEYRIRRPDGTERWIWDQGFPVLSDEGVVVRVVGIAVDITERRRAELARSESEARFRLLFEHAGTGILGVDVDGTVVMANPAADTLFGFGGGGVVGMHVDVLGLSVAVDRTTVDAVQTETRCVRRDKSWFAAEVTVASSPDDDPDRAALTIVQVSDITVAKQAQEAVLESEARLTEAQQLAGLGHWQWQVPTGEVRWSDQTFRIFGQHPTEGACYENWVERIHPADRDRVLGAVQQAVDDGRSYDVTHRVVRPDGTQRVVHCLGHASHDADGVPVRVFGTVLDVTEQHEADQALRESEMRLAEAQSIAHLGHWEWIVASGEHTWSPETRRLLGVDADAPATLEAFVERVHPDDRRRVLESVKTAADDGTAFAMDFRVPWPDGTERHMTGQGRAITDVPEGTARVLGTIQDVTELRHAEDGLRRSEEKYRTLVERAAHGIYRSTPDGQFLAANPAMVEMLGYESEADLLRLSLADDVYARVEDRAAVVRRFSDTDRIDALELEWRRRDGSLIDVRLNGRVVRNRGSIESYEMLAEDVTVQRALQAQLQQAQKMEAVGQLALGIAHDFNNMLTVVQGSAELLKNSLPATDVARARYVGSILDAIRRGQKVIEKLMGFSRRLELKPDRIRVPDMVFDLHELLRCLLPKNVVVDIQVDPHTPDLYADQGALEQVLLNLASNAKDAMLQGGHLTIRGGARDWTEEDIGEHGWGTVERMVELSVTDTGAGIPDEHRLRAFEPFYTTKPPGVGTGLGLAMVYGIIDQHRGLVWIESAEGQGTTIRIVLPVALKL